MWYTWTCPDMPEHTSYLVPSETVRAEQTIRKSRFIATVGRVGTKKEAERFIDDIRKEYPDASHNCYAFIVGDPHGSADIGMGDDGEVPGTAAKPMMNVLRHKNLGNTAAVVTRYFGRIKLGHGGLIRAYTGSLQLALDKVLLEKRVPELSITISTGYAYESSVRTVLKKMNAVISETAYGDDLLLHVKVPEESFPDIQDQIMNFTHGRAKIRTS